MKTINGNITRLLATLLLGGCTSVQISQGLVYNIDRAGDVKPGMSQKEVTSILGNPHSISETLEGYQKYNYSFQTLAGTTTVSNNASATRTGGTATIVFKEDRVISSEYEIFGSENFKRLMLKKSVQ